MQTEKPQTEKTQGMRFRNHISIIAEQTGGLLIALLIVLVPSLLENIDELMETGLEFMDGKWLLVNLGLILFFLVVIGELQALILSCAFCIRISYNKAVAIICAVNIDKINRQVSGQVLFHNFIVSSLCVSACIG